MRKPKTAFFAFILVFIHLQLAAQSGKENYALLWKISGNGLTQPSYLFGTMHLRDNRVFEFSDSVLVKLDACEAFASETRIDSSICQMLQLFEYGDTTNVLKNTLPDYTYRKINKAVYDKIGLRIENLEVKSPQNIDALLSEDQEMFFNEDREEELDFYLFKRAYLQGKPLYGLEYERDNNDLIAAYFQEFEINYQPPQQAKEALTEANLLQMLEFYRSGNLDSIAAYSIRDEHYSIYDYEFINGRNKKMVKNLIPLLQRHSTFIAVGAAHLPGKEGFVSLLQAKGFTVERVPATFNGPAEPALSETKPQKWHLTNNSKDGYQFATPGLPFKVSPGVIGEKITREAYYYFDVPTRVVYSARSNLYPIINTGIQKTDVFTNTIREWLFKRKPEKHPMDIPLNLKEITSGTYKGVTATLQIEDNVYEKMALFLEKNTLFYFLVEGKKEDIEGEAVNRFFSSIVITPPQQTAWERFTSKAGGFSIPFPQSPTFQNLEIPYDEAGQQIIQAKIFMSKDLEEGHTYLARYFDYPVGVGIIDKDMFFNSQVTDLSGRYNDMNPIVTDVLLDEVAFKKIEVNFNNLKFHFWTGYQGNRTYMLMAVPAPGNPPRPGFFDEWANQLQLEPIQLGPIEEREIPEAELRISLPTTPKLLSKEGDRFSYPLEYSYSFGSIDSTSGISIFISRGNLHRYAWFEDEAAMRTAMSDLENSAFTILYSNDTTFQGFPAISTAFIYPGTGNASLSMLSMDGRGYNEVLFNIPERLLTDSTINQVINDVKFENSAFDSTVYQPKGEIWLQDLLGKDDSLVLYAKETASLVVLQDSDLPKIYTLLEQDFENDTLGSRSIKEILFEKLEVYQDIGTMDFLRDLYPSLPANEKIDLLTTLTWTEDVRGKALFFQLAKEFPEDALDVEGLYILFQPFAENSILSISYLESLMELWDHPVFQNQIALVLFGITQDYEMERGALNPYREKFIHTANDILPKIDWSNSLQLSDDPLYQSMYYLSGSILKNVAKNRAVVNTLKAIEEKANPEILAAILPSLADLGEKMDKNSIERIRKDSIEWVYFLKTLQVDETLRNLPSKYRKQEDFLPFYLKYYGAVEDGLDYKGIQLLADNKKEIDDFRYTIHLFKLHIEAYGTEEHYWGIISQPANKNEINAGPDILYFVPYESDNRSSEQVLDDIWKTYLEEGRD